MSRVPCCSAPVHRQTAWLQRKVCRLQKAAVVPARKSSRSRQSVVLFLTSFGAGRRAAAQRRAGGSDVWGNSRRPTECRDPICVLSVTIFLVLLSLGRMVRRGALGAGGREDRASGRGAGWLDSCIMHDSLLRRAGPEHPACHTVGTQAHTRHCPGTISELGTNAEASAEQQRTRYVGTQGATVPVSGVPSGAWSFGVL